MKVGYTGTRKGMTNLQLRSLYQVIIKLTPIEEWHHGDCIGADTQSQAAIMLQKYQPVRPRIILHPPTDNKLRAFCLADESRDPLPYLERNKSIVDETDCLVACPSSMSESPHSGTWSTIDYARQSTNHSIFLILPNGIVMEHLWVSETHLKR